MDVMDFNDYSAVSYMQKAKDGYVMAIPKLFYSLKKSIDGEHIGENTKGVIVEILSTVASIPTLAEQATGITHGDPSTLIALLVDEVKTDSLTQVSRHVTKDVFNNLQMSPKLAKKALGIKHGRPPDPLKRRARVRLAILVLYYYEQDGVLASNRDISGAFVRAAAHTNKIDGPTDEQITIARHAWENHKEDARLEWKSICAIYARQGVKPKPNDDYELEHFLDGYVT